MIVIDSEEYLDREEVVKLVGLNQATMYERIRYGLFPPPLKLEIRKLWKKSDIEEYLAKKEKTNE